METQTDYVIIGQAAGVRELVDRFYDLMCELPEAETIRKLHPEDLTDSRDKLFKFLSGFLGGPSLYIEQYGHPRLRARHLPFPIGQRERDQWLRCMNQSIDERVHDAKLASRLKTTFARTADHMRNQADH